MYEIVLYEDVQGNCPILALIEELDERANNDKNSRIQLKQLRFHLDLLVKVGTRSGEKFVEHIRDGIWELKPGDNRVLFFLWTGNTFVILHSFRKKSQKTPTSEIEKAYRERDDWIIRHGHR